MVHLRPAIPQIRLVSTRRQGPQTGVWMLLVRNHGGAAATRSCLATVWVHPGSLPSARAFNLSSPGRKAMDFLPKEIIGVGIELRQRSGPDAATAVEPPAHASMAEVDWLRKHDWAATDDALNVQPSALFDRFLRHAPLPE